MSVEPLNQPAGLIAHTAWAKEALSPALGLPTGQPYRSLRPHRLYGLARQGNKLRRCQSQCRPKKAQTDSQG